MKRKLLLAVLFLFSVLLTSQAQNKSLGVGTATPNPNAVLHAESPTGNQGFIMPRLTTSQRTAMAALLTSADNGLMLYDTDLKTIYLWDGAAWITTAQVAGGAKLAYPYRDSVATATGTNDLFKLQYNNPEPKRILRIENNNASNGSSAVSVLQQGSGFAGYFQVNNPTAGGSAITGTTNSDVGGALAPVGVYGESTGAGSGASAFRINNPGNNLSAVYAETNGIGAAMFVNSINANNGAPAIEVVHAGLGKGAFIHADNGANTNPGLHVVTNGVIGGDVAGAAAILGETSTAFSAITGRATGGASNGLTGISMSSDPGSFAILGSNSGMGPAGVFSISNPANTSFAVRTSTSGSGAALMAENTGSADGFAGLFQTTNPSNGYPAIQAASAGSGSAIRVMQNGGGPGLDVFMQNADSAAVGLSVSQNGRGQASTFSINNASNNTDAILATTVGSGIAVSAYTEGSGRAGMFNLNNPSSTSSAVTVMTNGSSNTKALEAFHNGVGDAVYGLASDGHAGKFEITNGTNAAVALFAATNTPTGWAIGGNHLSNGNALAIWTGGIKVSIATVTTSTVGTRAAAYRITGGGTAFTLGFTPEDGDVYMVYNETGQTITFEGVTILNNEGKTVVHFGSGVFRGI